MNENQKKTLAKTGAGLVCVAYVGWAGKTILDIRKMKRKRAYYEANLARYRKTRDELAVSLFTGEITLTEYLAAMKQEYDFMQIVIKEPMY
jgi:hypothetical protein